MLALKDYRYIGKEHHKCIVVSDPSHLYITSNNVVSHNSPMTSYCICLCSYSLGKAWDLLGTPFEQFLEQSPMFERVPHREDVINADKDDPTCEKLVYSTAARGTARMIFRNNLLMKLMSTEGALLGNAQPLYSKIMLPDNTYTEMGKLRVGDKIKSPTEGETEVIGIFPQGERDIYEIELDDGRKVRSSDNHLWKVAIEKDRYNLWKWQIVNTLTLIKWLEEGNKDIEIYDESNAPEVCL